MTVLPGGLFEYTRRPIFVSASVHVCCTSGNSIHGHVAADDQVHWVFVHKSNLVFDFISSKNGMYGPDYERCGPCSVLLMVCLKIQSVSQTI
jgi:hypothetical protein